MGYQPLEDRILVKEIVVAEIKTESGIILDPKKNPTKECTVVSVGGGVYARETGVFMPTALEVGDIILTMKDVGLPVNVDGEELLVVREGDCILVNRKN